MQKKKKCRQCVCRQYVSFSKLFKILDNVYVDNIDLYGHKWTKQFLKDNSRQKNLRQDNFRKENSRQDIATRQFG